MISNDLRSKTLPTQCPIVWLPAGCLATAIALLTPWCSPRHLCASYDSRFPGGHQLVGSPL